jgi:hypothetical protein
VQLDEDFTKQKLTHTLTYNLMSDISARNQLYHTSKAYRDFDIFLVYGIFYESTNGFRISLLEIMLIIQFE